MNVTVTTVPEEQLSPLQKTHLQLAREFVEDVNLHPANIHNSVKIIGAYDMKAERIFVAPERLQRLSTTANTSIHELAHHESKADDGTQAHEASISDITHRIALCASSGKYDYLLSEAIW